MATADMTSSNWVREHHKQIDEGHVRATLKADKGEEAEFLSWSIEDFTKTGDNFATIVTSVKVSYKFNGNNDQVSYVVKINPLRSLMGIKKFQVLVFGKENVFYEHLAPKLNKALKRVGLKPLRIPKWYHTSMEEGKELVFLEDLRPRGFKMCDRMSGMDASHSTLVLEELARLHAASMILKEEGSLDDLAKTHSFLDQDWHSFEDSEKLLASLFEPQMKTSAKILRKINGYEKSVKWLEDNKPLVKDILTRTLKREEPFNAICHGDCWNNNILFRYDDAGNPVEVMLVDLQTCRVASFATDLNYFMMTSLTGDVRERNERQFLTSYYEMLASVMSASGTSCGFSYDKFLEEYRGKHEYGLLFSVVTISFMVTPKEELPDMDNIKEEDVPKLIEEMREKLLSLIEKNPIFRPRYLAIFDYMLKNGVIT